MTESNHGVDLADQANAADELIPAPGDSDLGESQPTERPLAAGTTPKGPALQRARSRRSQLHDAMIVMERTAAQPTDSDRWLPRAQEALSELDRCLEAHTTEVEGASGLLAGILAESPRLAAEIAGIRDDHIMLADAVGSLRRVLATGDTERSRRKVTSLLGRLALHRQRGADLVYEAYNVDIGASG